MSCATPVGTRSVARNTDAACEGRTNSVRPSFCGCQCMRPGPVIVPLLTSSSEFAYSFSCNGRVTMKIRITQDVPRYARLTKGLVVNAEPVASHPELMRVKNFGAFENGALVRSWELVLLDEEIEALLSEG